MLQTAIDTNLVRLADPDDEDDLLQMQRELHLESGLRDGKGRPYLFSENKVRSMLRHSLTYGNGSLIGIIGSPGRLEGSVCVTTSSPYYSDIEFLQERCNFVRHAFRQSHNAKILIAFSKAVASAMRHDLVMGTMSTERQPAKVRFYQRALGCEPFGAFFVFNYDKQED